MSKLTSRRRRTLKARAKIQELGCHRLCVHRTPRHIYAQVIDPKGAVLASASTLDKTIRDQLEKKNGGNVSAATIVGKAVAERARSAGVNKIAFDRSGFRYHGRIKALADAAREAGLAF